MLLIRFEIEWEGRFRGIYQVLGRAENSNWTNEIAILNRRLGRFQYPTTDVIGIHFFRDTAFSDEGKSLKKIRQIAEDLAETLNKEFRVIEIDLSKHPEIFKRIKRQDNFQIAFQITEDVTELIESEAKVVTKC